MIGFFRESKKVDGLPALCLKQTPFLAALVDAKADRGQDLRVEFLGCRAISYPKIDVIEKTPAHAHYSFTTSSTRQRRFSRRDPIAFPANPARRTTRFLQALLLFEDRRANRRSADFRAGSSASIRTTFRRPRKLSRPRIRAATRRRGITSSVTSVATPEDFFGHETQRVPVSAINLRSRFNSFSSVLRFETKK